MALSYSNNFVFSLCFLLQAEQGTTKADECYHFRNVNCQTYKTPDHKLYRQKYPESCLSKPVLRK